MLRCLLQSLKHVLIAGNFSHDTRAHNLRWGDLLMMGLPLFLFVPLLLFGLLVNLLPNWVIDAFEKLLQGGIWDPSSWYRDPQ